MPSFIFSQIMVANGTITPLTGWQYEYLPWPAEVTVMTRATTVAVVQTFTSGSETIVEESGPGMARRGGRPTQANVPRDGGRHTNC